MYNCKACGAVNKLFAHRDIIGYHVHRKSLVNTMSQKKILVVDDEDMILDLVSAILIESGYWVVTTKHAGLATIQAMDVDLIILDLKLSDNGDMDGGKILGRLWENSLSSVPVIVFSGHLHSNNVKDNLEMITKAWGKGRSIFKCVEKGSGIKNLVTAVDSYFGSASATRLEQVGALQP